MKRLLTIFLLCLSATFSFAADTLWVNGDSKVFVKDNKVYGKKDVGIPASWWKMTATGTNETQILDFATEPSYNASNKPNVATGPTLITTNGNPYYEFSGTQWFEVDNPTPYHYALFTNWSFAISAWFDKNEESADSFNVLVSKSQLAAPSYPGWYIYSWDDETISWIVNGYNAGAAKQISIRTTNSYSGVNHIVCVYRAPSITADALEIWINGVLQGVTTNAETWDGSFTAAGVPMTIGSRFGGNATGAWQGWIDDVRLFTNDVTESQIQNIYIIGRQ